MWLKNAVRNWVRRRRADAELDEEVRGYVEMAADEKMRNGVNARAARREATMESGGVEQVKERTREVRAGYFLETLWPLPVKDAGQLTYLVAQLKSGGYENGFSFPNYDDIRNQSTAVFSNVAGIQPFQMDGLNADGKTMQIWTNYVTGDFFEMLGIKPALGRFILPSEGKVAGADPVLVLSYSYWQAHFGGDPNIIGRKV